MSDDKNSEGARSLRAAFHKMDDLRRRFDEHAADDREELGRINSKLDKHGETLVQLRESSAGTKAALDAMTSELRHVRELRLAGIEASTTKTVAVEQTGRERMGWRYKLALAVLGGVGTGLGIVLTKIVG